MKDRGCCAFHVEPNMANIVFVEEFTKSLDSAAARFMKAMGVASMVSSVSR